DRPAGEGGHRRRADERGIVRRGHAERGIAAGGINLEARARSRRERRRPRGPGERAVEGLLEKGLGRTGAARTVVSAAAARRDRERRQRQEEKLPAVPNHTAHPFALVLRMD